MFSSSLIALIVCIFTLQGDYEIYITQETFSCRILGYMLYVSLAATMNAFSLQAIFRFCCVLYPTKLWFQKRVTYVILILFFWIFSFLIMLPLHLWFDIRLIPAENVCLNSTKSARALIWIIMGPYGLPIVIIHTIYLRITYYLHKTTVVISASVKRDILVIRRIILILIILLMIGTPSMILMLMLIFTKVAEPFFYRISALTISLSMSTLSVALIYISPQLKTLIIRSFKKQQVIPFTVQQNSRQINTITMRTRTAI